MSQIALARRSDTPMAQPKGAAATNAAAHGPRANDNGLTSALGTMTSYFPTEVNVTYVAVLAAANGAKTGSTTGQHVAFFFFLAITPVVVWALYAAAVRGADKTAPLSPHSWPVVEMVVATLAFGIWAAALPGSPLATYSWYSSSLAAVVVLIAAGLLGPIASALNNPITIGAPAAGTGVGGSAGAAPTSQPRTLAELPGPRPGGSQPVERAPGP